MIAERIADACRLVLDGLSLEFGGSGDNGPYRAFLWLLNATNDVAIGSVLYAEVDK
jgi:hypothetical protein